MKDKMLVAVRLCERTALKDTILLLFLDSLVGAALGVLWPSSLGGKTRHCQPIYDTKE